MTRVGVLAMWPKKDGATEFCRQLASARLPGVSVELLAISKSGRTKKSWGSGPFVPVKAEFAAERFEELDLLILGDLATFAPDTQDEDRRPAYLDAALDCGRPLAAFAHDGALARKLWPLAAELLPLPRLRCVATTRMPAAREMARQICEKSPAAWVWHPYLPFAPSAEPLDVWNDNAQSVVMTGRLTPSKGAYHLIRCVAGGMRRHGVWWGDDPYRPFGLYSRELAEAAREDHGMEVDAFSEKGGPFSAMCPATGYSFIYAGGYESLSDVDWSSPVHLNLTHANLGGTLEYSTLEALSRGPAVAAPARAWAHAEYDVPPHALPEPTEPDTAPLRRAIEAASEDRDLARRQRETILPKHAPEPLLKKILEASL